MFGNQKIIVILLKRASTPKISKYFSKVTEEEEEDAESPYKYVVSKVRSIAFDDSANDDDFKSPPTQMVQLKPPKAVPKVAKKIVPKRAGKRKNPMQRVLEDNFNSSTGVNGEQLQMALALSESSYVAENPEISDKSCDAQEKTKLFKQALEKFGLRCGGGKRNPFDAPKPRNPPKKSRYRFVTPILKLRTDEERQSLLVSKLSLLLTRNERFEQNCLKTAAAARNLPRTVHSDLLREHLCAGFENFHLNSLNVEELTEERFYVKNLNLTRPEATTCGCLLKNWSLIAGRDVSPSRGTDEGNKTETTHSRATSVAKNWTSMDNSGGFEEDGAVGEVIETNEEGCRSSEAPESEHQAIEPESEENSTKESRSSQTEDAGLQQQKVEGYRTDSEDLETFAFSNLTDLLRPSPEETEQATERSRCITPDLFDETEDDSSQSLLSPFKISPPFKNVTQRKKVEQNKSSNIVVVDLTYSSEEEADCIRQEKTSFIEAKKWNLEIETSHVQHDKICVDNSRSGPNNFEYSITHQLETKNATNEEHVEENDVVEETPNFDCDATIILNEAEKNSHVFNTRCSEHEDVISDGDVETPDDLGFDDDCNDKIIERSFADDQDVSKCEATSPNMNRTEDLNVTDYVLHILNNRNSSILRGSSSGNNSSIRTELFPSRESITVSDDELNYSSALSKSLMKRKVSYELSSSSDSEVDENRTSTKFTGSPSKSASSVESSPEKATAEKARSFRTESPPPEPNTEPAASLLNDSLNNILESSVLDKFTTPNCSKVVIKTDNVTPMPDYDEMDTPKVTEALDKFGLKPLKRKKGAEFLKYIYESTHPFVEAKLGIVSSDDEAASAAVKVVKKRRIDDVRNLEEMDAEANDEGIISDEMHAEIEEMQHSTEPIEILGDNLTADDEELVFERSQSKRVPSCRVPLHIVWHNFVSANPNVRENILLYEPLQLEVLHVMLKQQGYKFNIQDLLTFLDKKCITIRTNPTGSSSKRKQKKTF